LTVQLAQEFDADDNGRSYLSTHRFRLCAPDTRSRVVGYLATAPKAATGFRTDGVWVWPEILAEHARVLGVAPQEQLYDHMRQSSFLLPDSVAPDRLAAAVDAVTCPPVPDPPAAGDWVYLGGYEDSARSNALLRMRVRDDGSVAESRFHPGGWESTDPPSNLLARVAADRRRYVPITAREAADLNDRLCALAHEDALARARESRPEGAPVRLARLYDGEGPTGRPWFSPLRARIPEPLRRERLAAYLERGRVVVRANDSAPDPLDSRYSLPLNFRTDGIWVWPESLAHYVLTRGVGPELALLCHIEERGYLAPEFVPDEVVPLAAGVARAGPGPRILRTPLAYLRGTDGRLARVWNREPGPPEMLRDDLRWGRPRKSFDAGGEVAFKNVDEAAAVSLFETLWANGDAVPPLD
jgi:hypothetical protein